MGQKCSQRKLAIILDRDILGHRNFTFILEGRVLDKIEQRGRLVLGARQLAGFVFQDESKWRSILASGMRADLGLFMLGNRIAGYEGIIEQRLADKVNAASSKPPSRHLTVE
jgi:hypothetical protein